MESLRALNYHVLAAHHGEAALIILQDRRGEVDLVVSDVVMPVMGGIPLLRGMQERELDVKVILLTGHSFEQRLSDIPVGKGSLLRGWLSKPIQIEELTGLIAQVLEE